ncbi:MAG: Bug family tripartite tricarboxylate transporter substrate binding protein [Rhodospirillaceae bacterium]
MKKNVRIAACLLLAAALPAGAQTSGSAAHKGKAPTAPAASAPAKNYPIKPIRFIVPFAPGGTTDIVARFIGQKLGDDLGQPLIIDNRGGAGGTIGTDMLAIALPDGYTIMLNHVGLTYNVSLYERLPYDTVKDLAPVSLVGTTPNMLVVNTAFKARSVKELVDLARAKPDQLSYGSGGVGSSSHLAVEMLQQIAKVKFLHVPYKGAGPALTDTVSGQVQFMITTMPSAVNHVKSGRLRALAVSGSKRSPAMPELPTVMESGVPGYDYTTWYGILAPAGLPKPIATRLLQSVHAAVASPDLRSRLTQNGMEPEVNTPDRFAALIKSDIAKWSKIIRTAGIKGEQ